MLDLINVETSRLAVVSTDLPKDKCLEVIYKKTSNPYKKKADLIMNTMTDLITNTMMMITRRQHE